MVPNGNAPFGAFDELLNFDIFNCRSQFAAICRSAAAAVVAVDFQLIFHFDISICQ